MIGEPLNFRRFEAEVRLVGNEPRADGENVLVHFQVVLPERGPGLHNVHNDIGEAQDGGNFNGAVELDNVNVPALSRVIIPCYINKFSSIVIEAF